MLAPSGYVSRMDEALCAGCGRCVEVCPFDALSLRDEVARVDDGACMGCGVCVAQCKLGALTLVRDGTKGEPLDVRELAAAASRVG